MSKKKQAREKVIAATMELAAEKGWRAFNLDDIARKADISLKELRTLFTSRHEILAAFTRMIDDRLLDQIRPDTDESARERLFEVIMTRFEIMAPYKKALKNIHDDIKRRPELSASLTRAVLKSNLWMLTAAGIGTEGGRGALRVSGLTTLYARALAVWLKDDDPGLAKTMAVLDRRLGRAEKWVGYMENICAKGADFLCALIPPAGCRTTSPDMPKGGKTGGSRSESGAPAQAHAG